MTLILWASDLVERPRRNFWEPRVLLPGLQATWWASWAGAIPYAVGVADVSAAERNILDVLPNTMTVGLSDRATQFASLPPMTRGKVLDETRRRGITDPTNSEPTDSIVTRLATVTGNPDALREPLLDHWLRLHASNHAVAAKAISGASDFPLRRRPRRSRTFWCPECRCYHIPHMSGGSVVYTDAFTVGSNTNIDAYPSGAIDWAYNLSSGTNLTVNAANDRVQKVGTGSDAIARVIRSGIITGDQDVTATCFEAAAADDTMSPAVRIATAGTADCYIMYRHFTGGLTLYRVTAGAFTSLASSSNNVTGSATARCRATGAGATVSLEAQINALTTLTFADTDANRKTSGAPGLHSYADNANVAWLDDLSVDDLAAAAAGPFPPWPVRTQFY